MSHQYQGSFACVVLHFQVGSTINQNLYYAFMTKMASLLHQNKANVRSLNSASLLEIRKSVKLAQKYGTKGRVFHTSEIGTQRLYKKREETNRESSQNCYFVAHVTHKCQLASQLKVIWGW